VDFIRNGVNGILVPPEDPEALAGGIVHLWGSPEERDRLGKAARETARRCTWDIVAEATIECYRAVAV
jgi:glycosyltransferase involved in cell wall biosynthesis